MSSIPQSNALSEANPSSVQDLFNRNPAQLSQQDLDVLIAHYRKLREELAGSATVRHARVKKEPQSYNNVDFSSLL